MKTWGTQLACAALMAAIAGCSGAEPTVIDHKATAQTTAPKAQDQGKADQWTAQDAPNLFSNDLEYRIAELPRDGEAAVIPWAGNYWPVYKDSINDRWAGPESVSPAGKYGAAFEVEGVEDAVSKFYGIDRHESRTVCTTNDQCDDKIGEKCAIREGQEEGRCIPTWWGICHAWAPVAILEAEPVHPVTRNGVTFEVNDIKALLTLAHDRVHTKFVSLRCDSDEEADAIEYDGYGRPTGDDISCKDTNPGTYHVLLANYLGLRGESFVEDRTFDDEVWNQPIRAYRITQMDEVSARDANILVGVKAEGEAAGIEHLTHEVAKDAFDQVKSFSVEAGKTVSVAMTGDEDGDGDLYVRFGGEPTKEHYDCRPYKGSSNETCELTVPDGATEMFVAVNGYKAAKVAFEVVLDTMAGIPDHYVFNEEATTLYYVKSEVDYIAESDAHTDGNLADEINRYTRTDKYEYILEIDKDGKVFGGEWVGDSKRAHPDFLWLPTRRGTNPIAGGKIKWSFIKSILEESLAGPNQNEGIVTFREAAHVTKGEWKHFGPFNATQGDVAVTMTGSGDADLYVRKGEAPTAAEYDCRPYKNGSEESCSLTGAGAYYVSVHGYADSDFEFRITLDTTPIEEPTEPVEEPTEPVEEPTEPEEEPTEPEVSHLNETGHAEYGQMSHYTFPMVAGQRVVVRTQSDVDVDLYVRFNLAPTVQQYDARAYTLSGDETVEFTAAADGVLHIGVDGFEAGAFQLTTAGE